MASPQIENGYTRIANELLEQLSKTKIRSEALQLILAIIRKTYGFNKKKDMISTSQFMELTGLSRASVYRARRKLRDANMITIYTSDDSQIRSYSIQKNYDKWKVSTKMNRGLKSVDRVSTKVIHNHLPQRHPQKKDKQYTKEIVLPTDLDIPEFRTAWDEWKTHRKEIRRKLTPLAMKRQLNMLSEMGSEKAIQSINQSITNGWTGLFDPKKKGGSYGTVEENITRVRAKPGKYDGIGTIAGTD